jgi:hypothetical protein
MIILFAKSVTSSARGTDWRRIPLVFEGLRHEAKRPNSNDYEYLTVLPGEVCVLTVNLVPTVLYPYRLVGNLPNREVRILHPRT